MLGILPPSVAKGAGNQCESVNGSRLTRKNRPGLDGIGVRVANIVQL